ncbi:MAG: hypothetical protein JSR36_15795 [Proteobacteria bacterium]|nr:hypothetical protein [Pseudomonadota bacterium]
MSSSSDRAILRGLATSAIFATLLLGGCGGSGSGTSDYTVGGTVSGLAAGAQVQLLNNGTDALTVAQAGTFTFPTALPTAAHYAVSVGSTPAGQACTVSGGDGAIGSANVANVVVTCADRAFTLGGAVRGLNATGLVLGNGADTLAVPAGSSTFTMPSAVAYLSSYALVVKQQPQGAACAVQGGTGTMPAADVANVVVSCSDQPFALGGAVSGLGAASGLVLANGSDTLAVAPLATAFTFSGGVLFGAAYQVVVQSSPAGLQCAVNNGSGSMPAGPVTSVSVACAPEVYPVGGTVSGLGASGLVLTDGRDLLAVPAGATAFTMPVQLPSGGQYAISVQTQPGSYTCAVSNGSGTVAGAAVANILVTCAQTAFTVGGSVSGLSSAGLVLDNGSDSLAVLANAMQFSMPQPVPSGAPYNVVVAAHPPVRSCTVTNGSGTVGSADVSNVQVDCAAGSESVLHLFPADPGDGATPYGSLTRGSDGNFYGLTAAGGASNLGTVFVMTPDGTESVLYSFGGGADGANPHGSLIQGSDGKFYGMTAGGGQFGAGVMFAISAGGAETVLHSFGSAAGGQYPYGSLIQASDGNFYGMSMSGGAYGLGAVFVIHPDGSELVVHSFGLNADGQAPAGSLIQGADGKLYGMTSAGGDYGGGIVFSMTLAGTETILHSLGAGSDGSAPAGSLLQASDGYFYGLTQSGGANAAGAVIKIDAAGNETVLVSLGSGSDGAAPKGDLLQANDGTFYALTSSGGANGLGAVVQVSLNGAESVVYSFAGGADSQTPTGSLIEGPDGTLYGTTSDARAGAAGTVFQIN